MSTPGEGREPRPRVLDPSTLFFGRLVHVLRVFVPDFFRFFAFSHARGRPGLPAGVEFRNARVAAGLRFFRVAILGTNFGGVGIESEQSGQDKQFHNNPLLSCASIIACSLELCNPFLSVVIKTKAADDLRAFPCLQLPANGTPNLVTPGFDQSEEGLSFDRSLIFQQSHVLNVPSSKQIDCVRVHASSDALSPSNRGANARALPIACSYASIV